MKPPPLTVDHALIGYLEGGRGNITVGTHVIRFPPFRRWECVDRATGYIHAKGRGHRRGEHHALLHLLEDHRR